MVLNIIGTGLGKWDDLTIKGLNLLQNSDIIYYENYTSLFGSTISEIEEQIHKKIIPISRKELEETNMIINDAVKQEVSLLVIGDPLSATTHTEIILRADKFKVKTRIIHNTSIINAISETGLQLYKFGRTISLPFFKPKLLKSVYDKILENKKLGLHSLILLDIKAKDNIYMTLPEAIKLLININDVFHKKINMNKEKWIGCARISQENQFIKYGYPKKLLNVNFGKTPHSLVIPGNLHFMEEEFLKRFD